MSRVRSPIAKLHRKSPNIQKLRQRFLGRNSSGAKHVIKKDAARSSKIQVPDEYRIVNVRCHLPSAMKLTKKEPEGPPKKETRNIKKEAPVKKEYSPKQASSITKQEVPIVKDSYEEKIRKFREQQERIKERYSPRIKEVYVNPNKHKMIKESRRSLEELIRPIVKVNKTETTQYLKNLDTELSHLRQLQTALTSPPTMKEEAETIVTTEENETTADQILSEAHRVILLWLFNGIFPTNLDRKQIKQAMSITKLNK